MSEVGSGPNPVRVAWSRVGLFYGIAFGGAALIGLAFAAARVNLGHGAPLWTQLIVALVYMPLPMIAGLAVERRARRRPLLRDLGNDISRLLGRIAVVGAVGLVLIWACSLGLEFFAGNLLHLPGAGAWASSAAELEANLQAMLPGAPSAGTPPLRLLYPAMLITGITSGFTVNAVFALGEEYGWRGVLADELAPLGPARSTLLTGVLWGLWHVPLIVLGFNFGPQWGAGMAAMVVFCLALSPLLRWGRVQTGSVLAPAVLHGGFNGMSGLMVLLISGASPLMAPPVGLVGAAAVGCSFLLGWRFGPRRWARAAAPDSVEPIPPPGVPTAPRPSRRS